MYHDNEKLNHVRYKQEFESNVDMSGHHVYIFESYFHLLHFIVQDAMIRVSLIYLQYENIVISCSQDVSIKKI